MIANAASLMLSKQVESPQDVVTSSKSLADLLVLDSNKRIKEFPMDYEVFAQMCSKNVPSVVAKEYASDCGKHFPSLDALCSHKNCACDIVESIYQCEFCTKSLKIMYFHKFVFLKY